MCVKFQPIAISRFGDTNLHAKLIELKIKFSFYRILAALDFLS
jgi:hypothetical protein